MFGKVVVILDHHQHIAALDLLLGRKHVAADAFVVTVGALVRPRDDDHLVAAVPRIAVLQLFEKLAAPDRLDVRKIHPEARNLVNAVLEHAAHQRRIEQDARAGLLAHHIVHRAVNHLAVGGQRRRVERRTEVAPHGRQLRTVADQHQAAAAAVADVLHQVRQQRTAAEQRPVRRAVGEHRRLVHDEDRSAFGIEVQRKFRFVVGIGALAVDALVNRKGLLAGILCQHLGRTPRRSEQDRFDTQILKRPDHCRDERRLACSGISVEHENPRKIVVSEVLGQFFYDFFLSGSCFETNFGVNLGRDTCTEHAVGYLLHKINNKYLFIK